MSHVSPLVMLSSCLLLSACGGGSNSDDNNQPLPQPTVFNLHAKLVNDCGSESAFTDVELLLQDKNWQVISRHQANDDGSFAIEVDNSRINYTLVAKYQPEATAGIEAVSFHQVDARIQANYYATDNSQIDNSNCQCQTTDITLNHPRMSAFTAANSSAQYASSDVMSATSTRFNQVQTCRDSSQAWPTHSFTVFGLDSNNQAIGLAGFGDGLANVNAFETAANIQISAKNPALTTSQVFAGLQHFRHQVAEAQGDALIFDVHEYSNDSTYHGVSTTTFEDSTSIFGNVAVYAEHAIYSNDYNRALDLQPSQQAPDIDLTRLTEINNDGIYNYRAVNNHEMAVFNFVYRGTNPQTQLPMPVQWRIYAPTEGRLPIISGLAGYLDIINEDTSIKTTTVDLIQSMNSDNYHHYIDYYASGAAQQAFSTQNNSSDFAAEQHRYHIAIELK